MDKWSVLPMLPRRMRARRGTFIVTGAAVIVLALIIAVGVAAYYQAELAEATSGFVTGTSVDTQVTGTACTSTGGGALQIRLVLDYLGFPVHGELINAQYTTPSCDGAGSATTQVIHIANFSAGTGGWLTPIYPPQAPSPGELNFTVASGGKTYTFDESVPSVGAECVTLHVPSGAVTSSTTTSSTCD
jgi:hypothetical protein